MPKANHRQNKFNIKNAAGHVLTDAHLRRYIQCYCRGAAYQHNRQQNINYFTSNSFLQQFENCSIGDVCKAVQLSDRWNGSTRTSTRVETASWRSFDRDEINEAITAFDSIVEQVVKDYQLEVHPRYGARGKRARYRPTTREIFVPYSVLDWTRAGWVEYPALRPTVADYKNSGLAGVKLMALHELAHAYVQQKLGGYAGTGVHGSVFRKAYVELLEKYQERTK